MKTGKRFVSGIGFFNCALTWSAASVACICFSSCTLIADFSDPEPSDSGVSQDADPDDDGGNGPICGNDSAEDGEMCDGEDLRGETCESLEFGEGTLACRQDCMGYDVSGCTSPPVCGDGVCDRLLGENFENCPDDCGAKEISTGSTHTCALGDDGTVWCWGRNNYGQLGDGTTEDRNTPVQVHGLTDVKTVSAGGEHTCAVRNDGVGLCWGFNERGQLGDGTTEDRDTPVPVHDLTDVETVSAGGEHTCVVKNNGDGLCWGRNNYGQLGGGIEDDSTTPVKVHGLTDVKTVSAGGEHACAVKNNGDGLCWGRNNYGQLGDGTTEDRSTPEQLDNPEEGDWVSVSAGGEHACAVRNNVSVWLWCWGRNNYGQLGDGTTEDRNTPEQLDNPEEGDWVSVSAGGNHTCALTSIGKPYCWGYNDSGQLGNGDNEDSNSPVGVNDPTDVVSVSAGGNHTCALTDIGKPYCWGSNEFGQLGKGDNENSSRPVEVSW